MGGTEGAQGPDLEAGMAAEKLREGAVLEGRVGDEAVILVRHEGAIFAVGARCPHYGANLAGGLVADGTIRCPWHHAAFDLRSGEVVRPPAFDSIGCWQVEERGGQVRVTGRAGAGARRSRGSQAHGPESVVILGGGAAGLYAADTLRREGYERPITIIESGPDAPCDRPNLSKDYLAGNAPEEWLPLRPPSYYEEQSITLRVDSHVADIDIGSRTLHLQDGSTTRFDALLIATGAEPVRLAPKVADEHVHYLRTLADSRRIIAAAGSARRAVVLGASFIGLEVAASLRARGLEVTIVAPDAVPLERVLGSDVGTAVRELHEARGVVFRLGQTARSIERDGIVLESGERLEADLVVAGIGVRPRIELAARAGLATDRGILVDEFLETSSPGIYAAGDVARWPDPRSDARVRIEHWVVAERQGQTAARNMLAGPGGARERFDAVPFFWSNHYDTTIAYTGHAEQWDAADIAGDVRAGEATITYRKGDRVLAVATVGRDRDNLMAEARLEGRRAAAHATEAART